MRCICGMRMKQKSALIFQALKRLYTHKLSGLQTNIIEFPEKLKSWEKTAAIIPMTVCMTFAASLTFSLFPQLSVTCTPGSEEIKFFLFFLHTATLNCFSHTMRSHGPEVAKKYTVSQLIRSWTNTEARSLVYVCESSILWIFMEILTRGFVIPEVHPLICIFLLRGPQYWCGWWFFSHVSLCPAKSVACISVNFELIGCVVVIKIYRFSCGQ